MVTEAPIRSDGNGNYLRDADGLWHYARGGDLVPGARDLLLGELYPLPEGGRGRRATRRVPRRWLRRRSEHPLAWMLELADEQRDAGSSDPSGQRPEEDDDGADETVVVVSASVWLRHADEVVGMLAPELHPSALLGVADVAEMIGVSPATVRAYLHRRQMPPPVTRVGDSPMWTRPIIERWRWEQP